MTAEHSRWQDFVFPVGIMGCVLVILVPLPPFLMDLLLAVNITLSVVILLTTIYVRRPLEFSIFPSVLLVATLGRLVLNVATTRLILTRADQWELAAAGDVIRVFGQFVAGDRLVVGLIMFVIIVIIQFVVITKGATRISEVAARFALDGMPGRQMAIDADLSSGVIDQQEALQRRQDVALQADFYGAMDGASKFVRGDAIAALVITVVNVAGGLVVGVLQAGMSPTRALEVYTMLTIGDGLVSQVPALLISLAAGLLVTRSTQAAALPRQFLNQLFARPQALIVTAVFLGVLAFTNLPKIPLIALGLGCGGLALVLTNRERQAKPTDDAQESVPALTPKAERPEDYLVVDPMELEIGVGLIRLADPERGGDLLARISSVRQSVAADVGIVLPKVRIRDNMSLDRYGYRFKVSGTPVAAGTVYPSRHLAVDGGRALGPLESEPTPDPATGNPAYWIAPSARQRAESRGYLVQHPSVVLANHLQEVVREHADEMLTRDATRHLIDELRRTAPTAVDELIPDTLKLGEVQQVLQRLLSEQVPIRTLGTILEALGDAAPRTRDPGQLNEYVRRRLARVLCSRYRTADLRLEVVTLDPMLERQLAEAAEWGPHGLEIHAPPSLAEATCEEIETAIQSLLRRRRPPVVLASPRIRAGLKQLTRSRLPRLVVLSFEEITRDTIVESMAMVSTEGVSATNSRKGVLANAG